MDNLFAGTETLCLPLRTFTPEPGATYLTGQSAEERSLFGFALAEDHADLKFVTLQEESAFTVSAQSNEATSTLRLRSRKDLVGFVSNVGRGPVYLDITGLSHHVWAPILKELLMARTWVIGIYVEPDDYRPNPHPLEGEIYALSDRIRGLSPIPGFISLLSSTDENTCFVPLLGFEGTRLAYLLEKIQPLGSEIVPVVGVPGFRLEYPFHAYQGNRQALAESRAWKNVRYARANCPFSLYHLLENIANARSAQKLRIAPIGTKPHALGAVLYALCHPEAAELVYDHPIRKPSRTVGAARVLQYPLSDFYKGCTQQ